MFNQYIIRVTELTPNEDFRFCYGAIDNDSGYPCWTPFLSSAKTFKSKEKATSWFIRNSKFFSMKDYDKSSLCVSKIILTNVGNIDVSMDYETYKQIEEEKQERAEYERLKAKFEKHV